MAPRQQLDGLPVTLLAHPRNLGKAASLRTAFRYALSQHARCVIALDGDGQHDPADAPGLLAAWQRHPECIVIGSRLHDRAQFPPARYRANRFACFWISWAAGHPIADSQSGFRVYSASVMRIALRRRSAWQPVHFRERDTDTGGKARSPDLGGGDPRALPGQRAPQPLPPRDGHRQDRGDGRRPPAAKWHGAAGALAQPPARDGAAGTARIRIRSGCSAGAHHAGDVSAQ